MSEAPNPTFSEIVEKHFREHDQSEGVRAFNELLKLVKERGLWPTVEAMSRPHSGK